MKYQISWMERKNNDWIVANLLEGATEIKEVSINRTNKKGEIFPSFDEILNGGEVEGELWTSSAGRNYLFASKPKTAQGGGFKSQVIEKAQERKEASIERVLDRKEESIALMSAQRDATLLVCTFYKEQWAKDPILEPELDSMIKKKVIEFRDWYLSQEFTDHLPF